MREVEFVEFQNARNDEVLIQLSEDTGGVFHLIVKCKMTRQHDEQRVVGGKLTAIPVSTFTDETKHIRTPNERTGLVEYKMECMMNSMPGFGMDEFQAWLKETTEEEGE